MRLKAAGYARDATVPLCAARIAGTTASKGSKMKTRQPRQTDRQIYVEGDTHATYLPLDAAKHPVSGPFGHRWGITSAQCVPRWGRPRASPGQGWPRVGSSPLVTFGGITPQRSGEATSQWSPTNPWIRELLQPRGGGLPHGGGSARARSTPRGRFSAILGSSISPASVASRYFVAPQAKVLQNSKPGWSISCQNGTPGLSTGKTKVVKNLELCLEMWLGYTQSDGKVVGLHQAC